MNGSPLKFVKFKFGDLNAFPLYVVLYSDCSMLGRGIIIIIIMCFTEFVHADECIIYIERLMQGL